MSGHSKWSTIKRAKGANDAKRGQLFSKLARLITIAAKQGGPDVNGNLKLRMAVDKARASNMPKDNVERAIAKGSGADGGAELHEVMYEGYGPGGVAILVEAATDNKNRTTQEVKNILEKNGGSMGTPGSVAFQFEHKGQIFVEKGPNAEEEMLTIMDLNVDDVVEAEDGIEVYTKPNELFQIKEQLEAAGITVKSAELTYVAKTPLELDEAKVATIVRVIDLLDEHDDIQKVYANLA
jgi:YebC/PmpR family DNA-binding regulatory protein